MSKRSENKPLPRNGHTFNIGVIARISGCAKQKEVSLVDQIEHAKEDFAELELGYPIEFRVIATKAKGERLDRPEIAAIEAAYRSEELDFMWSEDLARMVRGEKAVELMGIGVDHGTRTLCPHDCLDTADDNWQEDALNASASNVAHNAHTSKRIKHKKMARFKRYGGATAIPIAGYNVPPDAETYDDWSKKEELTPWIKYGLLILRETNSGEDVADYFNRVGMPVGPYCRKKFWDGRMALRFYRNRILGGYPGRGFRRTKKHFETGRRPTEKNPDGPCFRECLHLAHVDIAELDDVIAQVADAHKGLGSPGTRRKGVGGRKRSRYPGGGATICWYCGFDAVWGGNGITENLMCSGCRERRCWNSVGFNGALAAKRVIEAITAELYRLEGFDQEFQQLVATEQQQPEQSVQQRKRELELEASMIQRKMDNISNAIAELGLDDTLRQKRAEVVDAQNRVLREQRELERKSLAPVPMPASIQELKNQLQEVLADAASTSTLVIGKLKKIVPEFHVYLVRMIDGGMPLPRARVKLALDGLLPEEQRGKGLQEFLSREITIDLFDPPKHEAIRRAAVAMSLEGKMQNQIAMALKVSDKIVRKALLLDRMMQEQNIASPYVMLLEPPNDYPKFRRHRHAKYKFQPRDGYIQRPL